LQEGLPCTEKRGTANGDSVFDVRVWTSGIGTFELALFVDRGRHSGPSITNAAERAVAVFENKYGHARHYAEAYDDGVITHGRMDEITVRAGIPHWRPLEPHLCAITKKRPQIRTTIRVPRWGAL